MSEVGVLSTRITANDSEFQAAIKRSGQATEGLGSKLAGLGKQLGLAATLAAAAGAAITTALVKRGLESVDAQAKLARQIGGTTAAVQAMDRAARLNGISTGAMNSALGVLNVRLAEAQTKGGPAADALKRLGLSARELSRMDADERMAALADSMQKLPASQMAFELRELGIRGREMAVLMQEGGDAIRQARKEVEGFGIALSDVDAAKIEAANDAMESIKDAIQGVSNQLAAALAPYIAEVATLFGKAAMETGGFRDQIERAVEIGIKGFGYVSNAVRGVQVVVQGVKTVIAELFNILLQGAAQIGRIIAGLHNLIPGREDIVFEDTFLGALSESFAATTAGFRAELVDLVSQPLPSENVQAYLEAVRERANEMAERVVEDRAARNEAALAAERQQQELLTEIVVEAQQIRESLDERYYRTKVELAEKAAKQEADAKKKLLDTSKQQFASGFAALGQHSKKMFEINKIAGISNAIISTAQGATKALELGWPMGPIAAAAITTQGLAQVATIRGQSFSGGGGGGGGVGAMSLPAGAAEQMQQPQAPQQTMVVRGIDEGSLFRGAALRSAIEEMLEYQRDGGKVVLG